MAFNVASNKELYRPDLSRLRAIAQQARVLSEAEVEGLLFELEEPQLSLEQVACLVKSVLAFPNSRIVGLILSKSEQLRRRLFGDVIVPMAPIEIANTCVSDCLFCGWRLSNRQMKRLRIPVDLLMLQVEYLLDLGINYIEFVSGDDIFAVRRQLPILLKETRNLFAARRIEGKTCFCTLALTEWQYHELREQGADAMIVWQETYDPAIFRQYVTGGPKAFGICDDWSWNDGADGWLFRYQSQERALRAGLEVAVGTMIGLNPDIVFEIVATVDHARYLMENYPVTSDHPLIIGMPIWNPIPTPSSDRRRDDLLDVEGLFPLFAAIYLLSLPSSATWVFPNCRVSLHTQVTAARVAGVFSSTEVKLGPGGYLPSVIHRLDQDGKDTTELRNRLLHLIGENVEDVRDLARALDEREQFVHHYHAHREYVEALNASGLRLIRGVRLPHALTTLRSKESALAMSPQSD